MEKYQKIVSDRIKNLCNELIDRADEIAQNAFLCTKLNITLNLEEDKEENESKSN